MNAYYMYTHEMRFDLKRVYWSGHERLRRWLARFDLTPARLDVLRLVLIGYRTQSGLRRALGIARSTMSRMLKAMEARGLLTRTSRAPERARKHISLSAAVRELATRLLEILHPKQEKDMRAMLGCKRRQQRRYVRDAHALWCHLRAARRALGDRADRRDNELHWPKLRRYRPNAWKTAHRDRERRAAAQRARRAEARRTRELSAPPSPR